MTPRQIEIVQETFKIAAEDADAIAASFYNRLFALDPSIKPMFHGNMKQQGQKLMASLALLVFSLGDGEQPPKSLQTLGKRHVQHGIHTPAHTLVEEALMSTLAEALGQQFTDEVEEAWALAYVTLAKAMNAHQR